MNIGWYLSNHFPDRVKTKNKGNLRPVVHGFSSVQKIDGLAHFSIHNCCLNQFVVAALNKAFVRKCNAPFFDASQEQEGGSLQFSVIWNLRLI